MHLGAPEDHGADEVNEPKKLQSPLLDHGLNKLGRGDCRSFRADGSKVSFCKEALWNGICAISAWERHASTAGIILASHRGRLTKIEHFKPI